MIENGRKNVYDAGRLLETIIEIFAVGHDPRCSFAVGLTAMIFSAGSISAMVCGNDQ